MYFKMGIHVCVLSGAFDAEKLQRQIEEDGDEPPTGFTIQPIPTTVLTFEQQLQLIQAESALIALIN